MLVINTMSLLMSMMSTPVTPLSLTRRQEETLRLKRIAAASDKPHDTPSYSSTTVTAVCANLNHATTSPHPNLTPPQPHLPRTSPPTPGGAPDRGPADHPHLRGPHHPGAASSHFTSAPFHNLPRCWASCSASSSSEAPPVQRGLGGEPTRIFLCRTVIFV